MGLTAVGAGARVSGSCRAGRMESCSPGMCVPSKWGTQPPEPWQRQSNRTKWSGDKAPRDTEQGKSLLEKQAARRSMAQRAASRVAGTARDC